MQAAEIYTTCSTPNLTRTGQHRPAARSRELPGCSSSTSPLRGVNRLGWQPSNPIAQSSSAVNFAQEDRSVKKKPAVPTQMYRLNVEPRVIDQLAKLAARTGEPKTRLARRLFTDAVMTAKLPSARAAAKS